jgi:integrase
MGLVRGRFGVGPERIAKMNQREASDFLLDVVGALDRERKSGNYIANIVRPLKSWLSWNGVEISRRIKIPRSEGTEVENEKTPTPEELKRILNAADPRARAACALMAFGGCRVEVLGSYAGDDGLEIRDLPEVRITQGGVEFEAIPTKVVVRRTLNKARHNYFTFLGEEGCRYLKEYLEWRLRRGEKLLPETPVISVHAQRGRTVMPDQVGKKHIMSVNIGDQIRKPIRGAGFSWRPYVLRRYFDVRMMMGESDGFVIRDWRQFFMVHKGDIEATYTVNKGITQDAVDKMREGYSKAFEKYLTTSREKKEVSRDEVLATIRKEMLLGRYGEEEIDQFGRLVLSPFVQQVRIAAD